LPESTSPYRDGRASAPQQGAAACSAVPLGGRRLEGGASCSGDHYQQQRGRETGTFFGPGNADATASSFERGFPPMPPSKVDQGVPAVPKE